MDKKKSEKIIQITLDIKSTMLKALKRMDELRMKLLIVNESGNFKSVLSIGDIQRAIIKGKAYETKISEILRDKITVCRENDSIEKIKAEMVKHRAEFMPVINSDNIITDVIFWDELFSEKISDHNEKLETEVVIMAGGKGERLKPLTNIIPKPLVPFGDRTIIEQIIDSFVKSGVKKFSIILNYKAKFIENYFSEIPDKKYAAEFIIEKNPNGTAGSLSLLKGKINKTFFVSNCDILVDQDYNEILRYHNDNRNELTIVSALKHYSIPYGTLEVEAGGNLKSLKEKPDMTFLINCGLYILEPHLIEEIPENKIFHITHLISDIKERNGRVGVFPVSEMSWTDIGDWKEYGKVQKLMQREDI